jgi:acyl transferase domain-containing protein
MASEVSHNKSVSDKTARYIEWGSFVHDFELFDATFFGISPVEASVMDPQQRLLLECAYLAFVDAGYTKEL